MQKSLLFLQKLCYFGIFLHTLRKIWKQSKQKRIFYKTHETNKIKA